MAADSIRRHRIEFVEEPVVRTELQLVEPVVHHQVLNQTVLGGNRTALSRRGSTYLPDGSSVRLHQNRQQDRIRLIKTDEALPRGIEARRVILSGRQNAIHVGA